MLYIPACLNPLPRLSSSGFAGRGLTKSLVTNDGYPPKSRGPALSHRPLRLRGGGYFLVKDYWVYVPLDGVAFSQLD